MMCFELDQFFEHKKQEEQASEFLSGDLHFTEEERREKYAITWVLMALTRAMDTLYMQINDPNSRLGLLLQEYLDS